MRWTRNLPLIIEELKGRVNFEDLSIEGNIKIDNIKIGRNIVEWFIWLIWNSVA
jgi:hypothetical protein